MFKIRSLLINMINKKINMLRDLNFLFILIRTLICSNVKLVQIVYFLILLTAVGALLSTLLRQCLLI